MVAANSEKRNVSICRLLLRHPRVDVNAVDNVVARV